MMLRVGANVAEGPCRVKKRANHTGIVGNRILHGICIGCIPRYPSGVLFLCGGSKSRNIIIITGDATRAGDDRRARTVGINIKGSSL